LERGRGTDVGLGLEPRTEDFHEAPDGTNRPWRQLLLAQPVVARIALDAFVGIDGGAILHRVDVDGAHRADVRAVAAGDALVGIDSHSILRWFGAGSATSDPVLRRFSRAKVLYEITDYRLEL